MTIRNLITDWKLGLLVCVLLANLAAGRVIYVDDDAQGANNGSSWKDAYVYLQDALADANESQKPVDIYVAQGTYTPDRGDRYLRGDKQAKFLLKSGIALKGGFAGVKADDPNARDCRANKTVLSGDLDNNDERRLDNFTENSDHVIWCIEADATAVLDGFTITGGYATDRIGGGLFNYGASPTVRRCVFFDNYASQGGGMANRYSSPTVIACTFTGNYAPLGGGGMYNTDQSHPIVRSCVFHDNRTRYLGGGGMYSGDSNPTVTSCFFVRNGAPFGGAMYNVAARPVINNCTFSSNHVPSWGGGMQNEGGAQPVVTNCILWGNSPDQIRTFSGSGGAADVTYSDIQGGHPGEGNIDVDPLVTPDGHLCAGSPCINAGDPSVTSDPCVPSDIDDEARVLAACVDMGADEFIDSDGDGLPDWWEQTHFGDVRAAYPGDDPDGDGLANLDEYRLYSSAPTAAPIRVDPLRGPFPTLQAAINVAQDGDTVLVAPGTYRGPNNRNLDFRGKSIVLHAVDGPEATTIDSQGMGRGFDFHWGETAGAAVIGFTVTNGRAEQGGAIRCEASNPQFRQCVVTNNSDPDGEGAALYAHMAMPTLADCTFARNTPRGVLIDGGGAEILGTVDLASNGWTSRSVTLYGEGMLRTQPDVMMVLEDCRIRCDISGPGYIRVPLGSDLLIESDALLDLGHETEPHGLIVCDGLLQVKDNAIISNAQVTVTRASFEDNAIVANCVISAEAGAPYGQFYIEDNVQIWLDGIEADGDRYLDLDPTEFDCNNIHIDAIDVNITEGTGGNYGGLFEARGRDFENPPCDSDKFFCQVDTVPNFDPSTWTLDQLKLAPGAKVNITNRFDFQAPYDSGGDEEVLYIKQLILGPDSILNTAFNRLYYETLIMDPTAKIMNIPLLGFSLNNIGFNDENEFLTRIKHNNFKHSEVPAYNRLHVERVEGIEPDPNGMMQMCNLLDLDPESSSYQQVISARAKGLFAKAIENKILIEFEYLFSTSEPSLELVVYLTDVPELLEYNDPDRHDHYIKVAHLKVPPPGRPGSPGSGRFGVFHKYVERGKLDFMKGTRIEFELVGPAGACVYIDNWDPQIHCNDLYCGDVTGDNGATVLDYLAVIGSVGSPAGLLPDGTSTACLEFGFGVDGRIDTLDVSAWAWMLSREELPNLCDIFLTPGKATLDVHADTLGTAKKPRLQSSLPTVYPPDTLLITGKSGGSDDSSKLEDNLYVFDEEGQYIRKFKPESDCTNGRLVRDDSGEIYQVNHEKGLIRLSDGVCVIPPATFTVDIEPRNGSNATISIGLHSEYISYDDESVAVWVGHPILDAAFDAEGYAYVTPVVINPDGSEPYQTVARLQLLDEENPPYRIVQLYDDPPAPNDNKDQNNLHEIEVSDSGNLYVINTGKLNESDILWVYDIDTGQVIDRAELGNPYSDCFLQAPVAMHISNTRDVLYMASSQNDPNSICTSVYALSESDLSIVSTMDINGMGHITDIAEDPITGTLWIVGFTMLEIPDYLESNADPFYKPYIAKIPYESNEVVEAMCLSDPVLYTDNDLALPLSVIWTATEEKTINSTRTAANWRRFMSTSPYLWSNADFSDESNVTLNNLLIFCDSWLRENP